MDYLLVRVVNIIVKENTLTKEKGAIYDGQYEIMIYILIRAFMNVWFFSFKVLKNYI
jgi:hypothetical protein